MKEKLELTPEKAREIIFGDDIDFDVIEDKIYSTSRWSLHYKVIVKRISDGKFFLSKYSKGATEGQEERPYEYNKPVFEEVFPVEKTITVYE